MFSLENALKKLKKVEKIKKVKNGGLPPGRPAKSENLGFLIKIIRIWDFLIKIIKI